MGPRRALYFEIDQTTDCRTLKYLNITDEFTTYYSHPLKHRSLNRRTPAHAYAARAKATPDSVTLRRGGGNSIRG